MNSRLYTGELRHTRSRVTRHAFSYSLHLYALDLDEVDDLARQSWWFGHNRIRPIALHDRDYLHPGTAPLRDKVSRVLGENGVTAEPARIVLVTALRQCHYVFNPASFFFCLDAAGQVFTVLVQVNNTFGDTHLYLLPGIGDDPITDKAFHVSPFFPRTGVYRFHLTPPGGETLTLAITYSIDGEPALQASFTGRAEVLTPSILARTVLGHPLRAVLTFPRILAQAARLHFGKKLPVHPRPEPSSPHTIRQAGPGPLERLGRRVLSRFFAQLDHGGLTLTTPEGEQLVFGDPHGQPQVAMTIHRHRFWQRAMLAADIGFGESYTDGDWDSPNLVALLSLLSLREEAVNDRRLWPALAGRTVNFLRHLRRDNTPAGSRRNISAHYDLGNDFYRLFLDPTMCYSSGLFLAPGDTLETAQRNKIHAILDRAGIGPDDHVLEIGCGWGGFALETVRRTGCHLTAVTVSREQQAWVERLVREAGLEAQIEVQLTDYRHVQGRFTKIVSIEMIEAVGHRHLGRYFQALDRLLAPGGRIILQAITMPDQKYRAYRLGSDWIRKHIFPGGHLPSLGAITAAMAATTRLNLVGLEDIGTHYVPTLTLWREALLARKQEVLALGFDETFLRRWTYYFSYCEAGFRNRLVRNHHLVLARMGEPVTGT
ncbi:MAG: DUF1365 family protein [Desulfobulbus sp.]|jgi:cyclopropane-fatty-acyl-phospholipid synthase|nr:DUF1365 family protein [Desulfobulbus sp.]